MENFKNVYKILVYQIIVAVVAIALSSALLLPNLLDIVESSQAASVIEYVKEFVKAVAGGDSGYLAGFQENFKEAVKELLLLVRSKASRIAWSLVGCALVYLFKRFADTLCYYTMGSILNDRMTTYAETPFSGAYVKNLGRASLYSVAYVPVVFVIDLLSVAICWFMFFYLLSFLSIIISLFLSVTLIVLCQAVKLTFTSTWLPAMTADNLSLKQAIRLSDREERRRRKKVLSTYIVSVYLVLIINVISAVCTFGSALLVSIPASYFYFICLQYVNYYTIKGKRYFIAYDKIARDRDYGDGERFFESFGSDENSEENGGKTGAGKDGEGNASEKETHPE